ncbi:MAG: hypothetical protein QE271_14535 [Bacteriovoracaceae bacterium]|nr:hypothetical protein [Bacteriovoracaceae bacterium]
MKIFLGMMLICVCFNVEANANTRAKANHKDGGSKGTSHRSPITASSRANSLSEANEKRMGVGVILGGPTGFTFKNHLQGIQFFDFALAYSLRSDETFHIHGDFLWQFADSFRVDQVPMFTYFGLGARFKHYDRHKDNESYGLGLRLPAGFGYVMPKTSIELFAEVALIVDMLESTDMDFNFGVGGRLWF